ncbi:DUF2304 domain-containing protein [Paenibacillus peoriae]|uniref:DUF2304 domain-containing protein n=1 Tax=Paenibacillus peoriae TaxID=59893 RepID=UPI00096E1A9A|nr:DUF2304 domain-containing protein [Paenibacillus peoriae]OMF36036.1 hypothetical protein BK134_00070 [Paenibacillus peoriae]
MISFKLQIILFLGSLFCFIILLNLLRKYRLELKYSMLWIAVMGSSIVLSIFPNMFDIVSEAMGIELPVNALFLLSLVGVLLIMFSLTLEVSKASVKIKELSQELGLIKNEVKRLKQNSGCGAADNNIIVERENNNV